MRKREWRTLAAVVAWGLAIACFLAGLGFAGAREARADTVVMSDGRKFVGQITADAGDSVMIDAMVSGIRVTMNLKRADIATVTKEALPAGFFDKKAEPAAPAPAPGTPVKPATPGTPGAPGAATAPAPEEPPPAEPTTVGQTPYLEIPIVGVFGQQVTPVGVNDALSYAAKHEQIKHIVFVVDSPGGAIDAADQILEVMKHFGTQFQYHALVQKAISASIWVVFSADTIHMTEGSTVGAAVAFRAGMTGDAEVDAKFNSAIGANITATAVRKNHFPILVRPMMIQDATVAAWRDKTGKVHLAPALPAGVAPEDIIFEDTRKTVLTLTQKEAVAIGLAETFNGMAADLGTALKLTGWQKYNDYGAWAMKHAAARMQDIGKVRSLVMLIDRNVREAMDNDPQKFQDYGVKAGGQFTDTSKRLWTERSDTAIKAWTRAQTAIGELRDLIKAQPTGGLEKMFPDLNIQDAYDRAGREIQRLRQNRTRQGL